MTQTKHWNKKSNQIKSKISKIKVINCFPFLGMFSMWSIPSFFFYIWLKIQPLQRSHPTHKLLLHSTIKFVPFPQQLFLSQHCSVWETKTFSLFLSLLNNKQTQTMPRRIVRNPKRKNRGEAARSISHTESTNLNNQVNFHPLISCFKMLCNNEFQVLASRLVFMYHMKWDW